MTVASSVCNTVERHCPVTIRSIYTVHIPYATLYLRCILFYRDLSSSDASHLRTTVFYDRSIALTKQIGGAVVSIVEEGDVSNTDLEVLGWKLQKGRHGRMLCVLASTCFGASYWYYQQYHRMGLWRQWPEWHDCMFSQLYSIESQRYWLLLLKEKNYSMFVSMMKTLVFLCVEDLTHRYQDRCLQIWRFGSQNSIPIIPDSAYT